MHEYLILFGAIIIGSIVWTAMQIGAWKSILNKGGSFRQMKGFLIGALICFPVFIAIIGMISTLLEPRDIIWSLLIAPGLIAYAIGLSYFGLIMAQRAIGTKPEDKADQEAQQAAPRNH